MGIDLKDYRHTAAGRGWGPGWPKNRAGDMKTVTLTRSGVRVTMHKLYVADLFLVLGNYVEQILNYLARSGDTGAFNNRPIGGTKTASNHSWGLAVDWKWRANPARYDGRVGGEIPAAMVAVFNLFGWAWGGHYTGSFKDAMHFEFMGTPAQAKLMLALAKKWVADRTGAPLPAAHRRRLPFPLPSGHWYGVASGGVRAHSGTVSIDQGYVAIIQVKLNDLLGPSHSKLNVDGNFGARTEAAVKLIQARNHWNTHGRVGPETWGGLF